VSVSSSALFFGLDSGLVIGRIQSYFLNEFKPRL